MRLQAHKTADGRIELWTRWLEEVSEQFPDVVEVLAAGLGPAEAIIEGEVVAFDAATDELHPFAEVMFRRRKYGIAEAVRDVPVGLFCFELLYADGPALTRLPDPRPAGRHVRRGAAGRLRPGRGAVPDGDQVRHRVLRRRPGLAAGAAGPAGPRGEARAGRRPAAAGLLVRAGGGDRGPVGRADPVAALLGRVGRDQGGRRAGHAVPAVYRALARRQGRDRRHHDRRAGRPVPPRPAFAGQG